MKNKMGLLGSIIGVFLTLLVGVCIIYLNYKGKAIGREYMMNAQQALFVQEEPSKYRNRELEELLVKNIKGPTKRIEMYDDNIKMMFQISFTEDTGYPSVEEFPNLREIVAKAEDEFGSGQAIVEINGINQSAYYEWLLNSENEERLVIIYSSLGRFYDYRWMDYVAYTGVIALLVLTLYECIGRASIRRKERENAQKALDIINRI